MNIGLYGSASYSTGLVITHGLEITVWSPFCEDLREHFITKVISRYPVVCCSSISYSDLGIRTMCAFVKYSGSLSNWYPATKLFCKIGLSVDSNFLYNSALISYGPWMLLECKASIALLISSCVIGHSNSILSLTDSWGMHSCILRILSRHDWLFGILQNGLVVAYKGRFYCGFVWCKYKPDCISDTSFDKAHFFSSD